MVQFASSPDPTPLIVLLFPRPSYQQPIAKQGQSTTIPSEKTSEKILRLMRTNPHITIAELATETGVTTRSIERNIDSLRRVGMIERIGPDKGGHWAVCRPNGSGDP